MYRTDVVNCHLTEHTKCQAILLEKTNEKAELLHLHTVDQISAPSKSILSLLNTWLHSKFVYDRSYIFGRKILCDKPTEIRYAELSSWNSSLQFGPSNPVSTLVSHMGYDERTCLTSPKPLLIGEPKSFPRNL